MNSHRHTNCPDTSASHGLTAQPKNSNYPGLLAISVALLTVVLSSCNSSDSGNSSPTAISPTDTNGQNDTVPSPVGGHVSNPEYRWKAIDDAASYKLVVSDHRQDSFAEHVTTTTAGCTTADTTCRYTPSIQMHDAIANWHVEALDSAGQILQRSENIAFSTLRSLDAQPYTDLDDRDAPPVPGQGWPTIEFDDYLLLNNDWNASAVNSDTWQQTVAAERKLDGTTQISWAYDWLNREDGDEYAVKSYPQIVYGSKLGAHVSGTREALGLPQRINSMDQFHIDYEYSETGQAERNLAFESFFHSDCNIGGPNFVNDNRRYEMMVWIASPSIRTPGNIKAETGVIIDNQLWDVWIKPAQDPAYIAFTAQSELAIASLNWNSFVEWTQVWSDANKSVYGIDSLDPGWCMSAIEFGSETWWGTGSLTLHRFDVRRTASKL